MTLEEKENPQGEMTYCLRDENTYSYEDGRTIIDTFWYPL